VNAIIESRDLARRAEKAFRERLRGDDRGERGQCDSDRSRWKATASALHGAPFATRLGTPDARGRYHSRLDAVHIAIAPEGVNRVQLQSQTSTRRTHRTIAHNHRLAVLRSLCRRKR